MARHSTTEKSEKTTHKSAEGGETTTDGDKSLPGGAEGQAQVYDEPDDELEEFEDFYDDGSSSSSSSSGLADDDEKEVDPAELQWEEGWEMAGWDDEDADDDFLKKLSEQLLKYKESIKA